MWVWIDRAKFRCDEVEEEDGWRNTPGYNRTTCWQILHAGGPSNCVLLRVCLLSFIGSCPMPQPALDASTHVVTNRAYFQKFPALVYVNDHKASSADFSFGFQLDRLEWPRTYIFPHHCAISFSPSFIDVPARLGMMSVQRCRGSESGKRYKRLTAMRTNGSRDPGREH